MKKYSNYSKNYFTNKKMFWYESFILENKINEPTKSIFQLLNIFGYNKKNILEIGFGKGILASLLINNEANYFGIDISEFAYNELKNTLNIKSPNKSYNVKIGNLTEIDQIFPQTRFDFVVFQSTLEHIYLEDIEIFMNKIINRLNVNAKIIIGNAQYPTGLHLPFNKNVGAHVTNINKRFISAFSEELNPFFDLILQIDGYFVLKKNDNFKIARPISLINNNMFEHIRYFNNKYSLQNQRKLYLKWHIFRRPIQLLKRMLELDDYA